MRIGQCAACDKLAKVRSEEAGHAFLEALRRRPKRRSNWGMRDWSEPERAAVAAFVEDLVGDYIGPARDLTPETVARSKVVMGITSEGDAKSLRGGKRYG
jgi:hypothetical protein